MTQNTLCVWDEVEAALPPIIPRKAIATLTGGLITRGRLANLDSMGLGPKRRFLVGRSVCYSKQDFIAWLKDRSVGTVQKGLEP